MTNTRIVVVSNRLPVAVAFEAGEAVLKRSVGGLATALGSLMKTRPMLWVGWPGTSERLTRRQLSSLKFPRQLVPVLIPAQLFAAYYERLANGVLWPLLHGMTPDTSEQEADWAASGVVMELFADAVTARLEPSDVVWIHDYHLPMLPQALRRRGVGNRLGFFLHTPFPEAAVFLGWKHHRELLESLVTVDVLGLQTERDVRNFQDCLAACGLQMKPDAKVGAFPIGIDYEAYRSSGRQPAIAAAVRRCNDAKPADKRMVLSVSRLDYTKGILEQLKAMDQVLANAEPGKLEYRLVVAPSRESLSEYRVLKDRIERMVKRINARYVKRWGIAPILYEYRSYGFEELAVWYRVADVLLTTPVIDGMNLVVKEYIAARGANFGAVVLSKTIGAAWQLREAIMVDPANIADIARGLEHALTMRLLEQAQRWNALLHNVRRQDVFWWTDSFLDELCKLELVSSQAP